MKEKTKEQTNPFFSLHSDLSMGKKQIYQHFWIYGEESSYTVSTNKSIIKNGSMKRCGQDGG